MSYAERVSALPNSDEYLHDKLVIIAEGLDLLISRRPSLRPETTVEPENLQVRRVFNYWKQQMGKDNKSKLTPERREKIQARLNDGYTLEDMTRAIDGCKASDFHMGREPQSQGRTYNDLTLIFRNGAKLEGFRDSAPKAEARGKFL